MERRREAPFSFTRANIWIQNFDKTGLESRRRERIFEVRNHMEH